MEKEKNKVTNHAHPFVLLFNKNTFNRKQNKPVPSQEEYEANLQFLNKYQNRSEIIGREGVKGIIKSSSIQINNPVQKSNSNSAKKAVSLPPIQQPMNIDYNILLSSSPQNQKSKTPLIYKPNNKKSMDIEEWKKYPNVIPVSNPNKVLNVSNNYAYLDRSYIPYTYKEYIEIMNEYKNHRFGGLGANLGTREWAKQALKFKKMNEYGVNVVANYKGIKKYKTESPNEERKLNLEKYYKMSKRYKTEKYGKGVMLNKLRRQKELEKQLKLQKEQEIQKSINETNNDKINEEDYQLLLSENRQKYIERLEKLKHSLINGL